MKMRYRLLSISCLICLVSCGQTGKLYLPHQPCGSQNTPHYDVQPNEMSIDGINRVNNEANH